MSSIELTNSELLEVIRATAMEITHVFIDGMQGEKADLLSRAKRIEYLVQCLKEAPDGTLIE